MLPQLNYLQDYFLGAMAILSDYFPVEYSALVVQDPQKDSLCVEAVYGIEKEAHPTGCSGRKGVIGKVLESRQPMAIHNLGQEPLYLEVSKGTKRLEKIQTPLLSIPLVVDNEPFGVVTTNSLYGPRDEFTEDFQFFSILSAILSPVNKNYLVKREEPLPLPSKSKTKSFHLDVVPVAETGTPAGRRLAERGLRKGDVAALICTLGEGWGRVWIDGEMIDLDVGAFKPGHVARVRELGRQELWVDVVRGNGSRGWLRLGRDDLGKVAGADRFE